VHKHSGKTLDLFMHLLLFAFVHYALLLFAFVHYALVAFHQKWEEETYRVIGSFFEWDGTKLFNFAYQELKE